MKRTALVLGLSMVLAGCSGSADDKTPTALPPVSASAEAPGVPEGSATTTAEPAEPPSADGAANFVRRYVSVLNTSILTNDNAGLRFFSSPQCKGCQRYIDSITAMAGRDARISGQGLSIVNLVPSQLEGAEVTVLMDFNTSEYIATAPDGATIARLPPADGLSATLRCVHSGTSWTIEDFDLVAQNNAQ